MKTVDVQLHDPDPTKPPHVIKQGADLLFDIPCGPGLAAAGVLFRPMAAGWLRLAARRCDYLAEIVEGDDGALVVHLRPVVEPAKPAASAGVFTEVHVPSVEWYPADVGEA